MRGREHTPVQIGKNMNDLNGIHHSKADLPNMLE